MPRPPSSPPRELWAGCWVACKRIGWLARALRPAWLASIGACHDLPAEQYALQRSPCRFGEGGSALQCGRLAHHLPWPPSAIRPPRLAECTICLATWAALLQRISSTWWQPCWHLNSLACPWPPLAGMFYGGLAQFMAGMWEFKRELRQRHNAHAPRCMPATCQSQRQRSTPVPALLPSA